MMTITNKLKPLVLSALVASCLTMGWQKKSEAAPLVVDNFLNIGSTPETPCINNGFGQCTYSGNDSGNPIHYSPDFQVLVMPFVPLGGSRQVSIEDVSGSAPSGTIALNGVLIPGALGLGSPSVYGLSDQGITSSFTATLLYNASGLGLNLNANGYSQLILDINSLSTVTPTITAKVTLVDSSNNTNQQSSPVSTTGLLPFNLNTFTGVNLGNLKSIQLDLTPDATWDGGLYINNIYFDGTGASGEIPEPTSVLSIVGVGVLAFASRRQKKN